jgi:hypothetical protein
MPANQALQQTGGTRRFFSRFSGFPAPPAAELCRYATRSEDMTLKQDLLNAIASDAVSVRELLSDTELDAALNDIGVLPKTLELHAPSRNARTMTGLGRTLCGINSTRHPVVTCKKCLRHMVQ